MDRNSYKAGSAYLTVLGALVVLAIISFSIIKTNTNRSFSTRFMSNEKKAEAVLESAADLMLGYIKNKMNEEGQDFFHFFRIPAPLTKDQLWSGGGENIQIDVSKISEISDLNQDYEALKPLKSIIESLGEENVDLKINCRIRQAEAFSTDISNYEIVGITKKSNTAKGTSAKFLDSINSAADTDGPLSSSPWAPSDWKADFKLPSLTNTDVKTFSVDVKTKVFGITVTVSVKVKILLERIGVAIAKASVSVVSPVSMPNVYQKTFDFNKILSSFIDLKGQPISIEGMRRLAMKDSDNAVLQISYQAGKFKTQIDDEYDKLKTVMTPELVEPDGFGSDLRVVEKGGLLELTGIIDYYPHGKDDKEKLTKKLVTTIPFKVSDIQPIAPEYSFFVSSSDLISEGLNTMGANKAKISGNVGAMFSVHSVPEGNFNKISGFNFDPDDKLQIPGMLRINSETKLFLNTFVGTPSEPYLTELNVMTSPKVSNEFKNIPVFQWRDAGVTRNHEIDFPVLFDPVPEMNPIIPLGLAGVETFFKTGGIALMKSPSLLYGSCHLEYPLGISIEAPLNMIYANAAIEVKPSAKVDLTAKPNPPPANVNTASMAQAIADGNIGTYSEAINDNIDTTNSQVNENSKIFVKYENIKTIPYGMLNHPSYNHEKDWDPGETHNLPANCYSLMQYAKKATYFYDSAADFFKNHPKHKDDDTAYDISGVIYIKGSMVIANELKVRGKGQIVCKNNISFNNNVVRSGDDTVFSLIARGGAMYFNSGCTDVQAACYSNLAPVSSSSSVVKIHGNLVANEFDRDKILNLEIFYNPKHCRASPLSVMRDVGKFSPQRYWVSFAENWSSFKYEKL